MHEPARDESNVPAVNAELADGTGKLDDRHFISRERFTEILADTPSVDYRQFCEEIDGYVDSDPTLRL